MGKALSTDSIFEAPFGQKKKKLIMNSYGVGGWIDLEWLAEAWESDAW